LAPKIVVERWPLVGVTVAYLDQNDAGLMANPNSNERFVTDAHGQRVAVILGLDQYEALIDAAEELEDIKAFDEAKRSGDESIPFDQALREIREGRT
jgi:PHD/YefM family antitoxin component YafN of YafNO toxin-antitoxin module